MAVANRYGRYAKQADIPLEKTAECMVLQRHYERMEGIHMRDLFAADPTRFQTFSRQFQDLLVDFSKNRITAETLELLLNLARAAGVEEARRQLFAGDPVNWTEHREALHIALRNRSGSPILVEGQDVMLEVGQTLERMKAFSEGVRDGTISGTQNRPFRTLVHIGIGGSYLGPKMILEALRPYASGGPEVRFIANVDGADFVETTRDLDPRETLFVVASKTFRTRETLMNAQSARQWLVGALEAEDAVARHFAALTANGPEARRFGIEDTRIFPLWDWVGGRYSWASAIGLPVACGVGFQRFLEVLEGAHAMDRHFRDTPLEDNIPVLLAMIGVWYNNFFGVETHAILPYDRSLGHFVAYFQQGEMESNGKSVLRNNSLATHQTGQIIWGEQGTNSQHSFFQLLHQGTKLVSADFIAFANSHHPIGDHHLELLANCFAQSEALMMGRTAAEAMATLEAKGMAGEALAQRVPQVVFQGNRPSNTLLFDQLTPHALGSLIALYEMKTFVQGVVWRINSFDQWGVELGKALAGVIATQQRALLSGDEGVLAHANGSTRGLLTHFAAHHRKRG